MTTPSNRHHSPDSQPATREEMLSAMFANMVIQQTNMAMMLMGKVAHPESGEYMHDLEAARMFIDQLEMLEAKTKGNLSKQEEGLMRQALSALHMTFVEAVDAPASADPKIQVPHSAEIAEEPAAPAPAEPAAAAATPEPAKPAAAPAPAEDDSRKKFSKKY